MRNGGGGAEGGKKPFSLRTHYVMYAGAAWGWGWAGRRSGRGHAALIRPPGRTWCCGEGTPLCQGRSRVCPCLCAGGPVGCLTLACMCGPGWLRDQATRRPVGLVCAGQRLDSSGAGAAQCFGRACSPGSPAVRAPSDPPPCLLIPTCVPCTLLSGSAGSPLAPKLALFFGLTRVTS